MFTCEYAEDAGATADIEYNFILEEVWVEGDGSHISFGPDCIFEHFLMNGEVRVAVEIVVFVLDIAHVGS